MLYGAKCLGQYHFFRTEEARTEWIKTLPETDQKYVETWTTLLKGAK